MRQLITVITAGALSIAGCNAIFGLDEVEPLPPGAGGAGVGGAGAGGASTSLTGGAGGVGAGGTGGMGAAGGGGGMSSVCDPGCDPGIDCIHGMCVDLVAAPCEQWFGANEDPDTVWLGFMGPLSGVPGDLFGIAIGQGFELAIKELQAANIKIGGILCDTEPSSTNLNASLQHLSDTLRVPAIIGPVLSDNLMSISQIASGAGTLLISPSATLPSIRDIADNGFIWRTAPNDNQIADAVALIVEQQLDPMIGGTLVVSVIFHNDPSGNALRDRFRSSVVFNNTSGAQNEANGDLIMRAYDANTDFNTFGQTVASDSPHVVIGFGGPETWEQILEPAENNFVNTPLVVLTSYATFDAVNISTQTLLKEQTRVVLYGYENPLFPDFVNRIVQQSAMFGSVLAANAYDATIIAALAASTINGFATGAQMKDALALVSFGNPVISAEPNALGNAFAQIQGGINLEGTSGPLTFDVMGDVEVQTVQICFPNGVAGSPAVIYDPYLQNVLGEPCP